MGAILLTGMPGWRLPDQQTWQLVSYIRNLPLTVSVDGQAAGGNAPFAGAAHYAGSTSCKSCHNDLYERWRKTPMANVVRDPREHPGAIIPDLSKLNPLVRFTAGAAGSLHTQLSHGLAWNTRISGPSLPS